MKEIRCPICKGLIGFAEGKGEIPCRKCRKGVTVCFDTEKNDIHIIVRHSAP